MAKKVKPRFHRHAVRLRELEAVLDYLWKSHGHDAAVAAGADPFTTQSSCTECETMMRESEKLIAEDEPGTRIYDY